MGVIKDDEAHKSAYMQEFGEVKRTFTTGATRDTDLGKQDYEGFLSPRVLKRFAEYMTKNRAMKDGSTRASDNWQKGSPRDVYMKSAFRHFMDWWAMHRQARDFTNEELEEALAALLFNVMGYLHEELKGAE